MLNSLKRKWVGMMNNHLLKDKLYIIIFGTETPAGKLFDVVLIACITLSILLIIIESMTLPYYLNTFLETLEYGFTFFFTIEYLLRLYCSPNPRQYALSFFGIVDLLATLPLYISWIFGPARYFMVIRTFRLIRVFRVFKLFNFLNEGNMLMRSMQQSLRKIVVFFLFVSITVLSIGTLMFIIEGQEPNTEFTNIPNSIYWAIVTMTTVGYGDITPVTGMGKFISAIVMLLGYTVIAVPTGIVSASMMQEKRKKDSRVCPNCGKGGHENHAEYCKYCGSKLESDK